MCTILTNFNMQIALIVVIFHSFDTIIITIILIILEINNKFELKGYFRQLPVTNFKRIDGCMTEIPSNILDQLSTDHTYLYHMGMAVQIGESYLVNCGYANRALGEIHHARWLTRANRVLRLYTSKSKPSPSLVKLVSFLVSCYIPGRLVLYQATS